MLCVWTYTCVLYSIFRYLWIIWKTKTSEPEPQKVSKKDKKSKKKDGTEEAGVGDSKKAKKMAKILAQMDDEIEPDVEVWGFKKIFKFLKQNSFSIKIV